MSAGGEGAGPRPAVLAPPPDPGSLARRAVLAVALTIGFYALALGIAGALLSLVYAALQAGEVNPRLLIFAGVGGLVILWSIMPRPDRFHPPGPALQRATQPRLFELIERVAQATGQAMPAEVYLVPEFNGWVAQRGGVMGIGSRRVMGLGVPLLQALVTSQLVAVLAHEFGHFYGGDTKLGPWVYHTRAAIGRTLQNLSRHSALIMKPFEWYATLFLRVTHAVSRQQELSADLLAARVAGARNLQEALQSIHAGATAFEAYWNGEVAPVLQSGFHPPLAAGFARFMASPAVSARVTAQLEEELRAGSADPFDTHPPLVERVAAVAQLPDEQPWSDGSPAIDLLDQVPALEQALIRILAGPRGKTLRLPAVSWEEVGEKVWRPLWAAAAAEHRHRFAGVTPLNLAELGFGQAGLPMRLGLARTPATMTDEQAHTATFALGAVLVTRLVALGWTLHCLVAEPVELSCEGDRVRPFEVWRQLVSGALPREEWRAFCERTGIATLDLGVEQ